MCNLKQIVILAFLPGLLWGQAKKLELGVMIGNNGQLNQTLHEFYTVNDGLRFTPNSHNTKASSIKYSASARYFFKDNFSARIKFGRAYRKELFTQNNLPTNAHEISVTQTVNNINPSVCFSKRIDRFEMMTGVEIPLMWVGKMTSIINDKYWPDSVTMTPDYSRRTTTGGGFIWGINHFVGVKYYFNNCLSIGGEMTYGLLFARLGDKYTVEYASPSSQPYSMDFEYEKKYKRTFFSTPEILFGLFIQLGRNKTKA